MHVSSQAVEQAQFLALEKNLPRLFAKNRRCRYADLHSAKGMHLLHCICLLLLVQVVELILQISSVIPSVPTRLAVTIIPLKYIYSGKRGFFSHCSRKNIWKLFHWPHDTKQAESGFWFFSSANNWFFPKWMVSFLACFLFLTAISCKKENVSKETCTGICP